MKKPNFKKSIRKAKSFGKRNCPLILTIVGVCGLTGSAIMAVKETPKALRLLEEEKERIEEATGEPAECIDLSVKDQVRLTWKCYIPSVGTALLSGICIFGANKISTKRTAALATAYQLSTAALSQYKDAIIETVGEKKAKSIEEKAIEKKVEPVKQQIINYTVTDDSQGFVQCLDGFTNHPFRANLKKLESANSKLHDKMDSEEYISLNYVYDLIGRDRIPVGDLLGWNIDRDGKIDIELTPIFLPDHGNIPCVCVNFVKRNGDPTYPDYEFDRFYY